MYIVVSVSYTFSILSYLRIHVRVVSVSGHHRSRVPLTCTTVHKTFDTTVDSFKRDHRGDTTPMRHKLNPHIRD